MIDMTENPSVQSDEGDHSAFFYGTLMAPEVFYTVCYGTSKVAPAIAALHEFRPALLPGYCRRRVKSADYPGVTPDAVHSTAGTLVTGLTRANMRRLDNFEGHQYERRHVRVQLVSRENGADGGGKPEEVDAYVYVFIEADELEDREWDLEEFRREKLSSWTRAGYIFEQCDPDKPALVAMQ